MYMHNNYYHRVTVNLQSNILLYYITHPQDHHTLLALYELPWHDGDGKCRYRTVRMSGHFA